MKYKNQMLFEWDTQSTKYKNKTTIGNLHDYDY